MKSSRLLLLGVAAAGGIVLARVLAAPGFDWRGKVVLITGGSRGLGLVLARKLAQRGAAVAICARDAEELRRAEADIRRFGGAVRGYICDVTRPEALRQMIDQIELQIGAIDVLINNAGIITMGPVEEMTEQDFEEAMRIYFWAPLRATLAVLPRMRQRRWGRIVNISSIGGKVPVPHLTPYCAAKFALTGLSGCLRAELAGSGVGVTTICPFVMRTGSQVNASFKGKHRAEFTWFMFAGSSAPFSVPVERAADRIILAAERAEPEVMVGIEAKAVARLYGLSPGLALRVLGAVNRLLPGPGGIGYARERGLESRTMLATSLPTRPIYKAALKNNQVTGHRRDIVESILGGRRLPDPCATT